MANITDLEYRELDSSELAVLSELYEGELRDWKRIGPKGYCIQKKYLTLIPDIINMELKEGDVWVTSFQRSGTTWTQELVRLVINDFDYEKAAAVPLTERYSYLERPPMFYDKRSYHMDLPASVHKVADFFGKEVTPAQMKRLCEHLHIDNFKQNKSVNLQHRRELGLLDCREDFIRKGWRDYFDEEMTQQAERWIKENLADTDLRFPSNYHLNC